MKNMTDAKRPLVFEITTEDVTKANRYNKNTCVVANALRDLLDIEKVEVGYEIIRLYTPKKVIRYTTPANLRPAVALFDQTGFWELEPGLYQLTPPKGHRQLDYIRAHPGSSGPTRDHSGTVRRRRNTNPRVIEFAKIRKAA